MSTDLRQRRRHHRRLSVNIPATRPVVHHARVCQPLPHSLDALDLPLTQSLAGLRFLILENVALLEERLSSIEFPDIDLSDINLGLEDPRSCTRHALDALASVRQQLAEHLPSLTFDFTSPLDGSAMEHFLNSARIPEIDVRAMQSRLSDIHNPLDYLPQLSLHLNSLRTHLGSFELPAFDDNPTSSPAPTSLADMVHSLKALSADLSDMLTDLSDIVFDTVDDVMIEGEEMFERATCEVRMAVKHSFEGVKLIGYHDLPERWRNNPFVRGGYRFIPLERWPLILMSLFALHNETLNIHTHLIPFVLWTYHSLPSLPALTTLPFLSVLSYFPALPLHTTPFIADTPELLFTAFALLCLFSSAVWHTMAGCADHKSMEFCARVDYVGIGWLISASVGTVVHYGFRDCHPFLRDVFLACCFLTGLAGNVFPFMDWFNRYEYRGYRIAFFVALALSSVAPLAALVWTHSLRDMIRFVVPIMPSVGSYLIGLIFYASHVPERWLPERWGSKLDSIGGGSHCIWHCFIVLAVSQHKTALRALRGGMDCPSPEF
ncbi:hypothetical protein HGRIS_002764 [Hohenbuehelia grisea]|uniref:HlyIII-domain-containing protein n=1 Tax=Hohenbuehelia grisea TaxID=104357 RepID=A0ABR3JLF1_9AGAR